MHEKFDAEQKASIIFRGLFVREITKKCTVYKGYRPFSVEIEFKMDKIAVRKQNSDIEIRKLSCE